MQNNNSSSSPLDRYSVQPSQKQDDSPFYKSAAPSISLPKGGGALKGIDEKFSVNALNGTAGLEIPLPLSPGRGGFTPALSLSYNSGSGNSEFGLGFSLGLPGIQRKTDKQLPRYNDGSESDVFLLAGAEDLVPSPVPLDENGAPFVPPAGYSIKYYRPRIEGLFARIEYIKKTTGGSGGWWRVTTKDNITTYYGLTAEGRIADPENDCRIFKWLPQLTVDHKGNVQQYIYAVDTNDDGDTIPSAINEKNRRNGNARYTNTYLKHVLYCNQKPYFIDDVMDSSSNYILESNIYEPVLENTIASLEVNFLMQAVLDYGDHNDFYSDLLATEPSAHPHVPTPQATRNWPSRSDAFSDFHAGFEIRTYRKCRRVLMFHHFQELGDKNLVRALELGYENPIDPFTLHETASFTEADLIISATQRGYTYDYDTQLWHNKALPAMTFNYRSLQWDKTIHKVNKSDFRHAPQGLTGPYQWMDFEGEGISGILTEQAGGWFYKNNLGNVDKLGNVGKVHFDTAKPIAQKPNFTGLGGGGLQWQDLDADGRRQVVAEAPVKGFWELDNDQRWQPFRTFSKNGNIDMNSPFTKMLDLNGDGKADLLITEDRAWTWYENLGKEGFERGGNAAVFNDEEKGPVLLLRDAVQSIFLADINGDGMTDLVRIKNREICYWPNMGYGKFGAKVTMANAPVFQSPDNYNPLYLSLADISGTGAADLIYVGKNKCTAWINLAGNAWSDAMEINPLPGTDAMSKISVVDFLGNGTACIVWSSPLPQHATAPLQYIDLMDGKKPYLMSSYNSGMGKTVSVKYKSSTQFYLDDKLNGIPWATKLPFPVQCIEKVTTKDLVSGTSYTQSYHYRHGYYDHEEREFRGFGYVETTDIDSAAVSDNVILDQKPVLTKTWNHTGAWIRQSSLLKQFQKEYFPLEDWDDTVTVATLPVAANLNAQEWREAHRALKGSPLRQEVYAIDGTEKEGIPYSVTATTYHVKMIQPKGGNRYACFINFQEQSVAFSCERGISDARITHQLTLETDEYGNVRKSASIAYPRKDAPVVSAAYPQEVKDEQERMHISYSENAFTNDIVTETNHYRLRVGCEAKAYEVLGIMPANTGLWTIEDLRGQMEGCDAIDFSDGASGAPEKRLLSHSKALFKDNDATDVPLEWESLESLAIPHEQYQLAFTEELRKACYNYGTEVNGQFPNHVTALMLQEGGYVHFDNDNNYWLPSGKAVYSNTATQFYTPEIFTDPWGNTTTIQFWGGYWLLPKKTADAIGNTATIKNYDMRILQPVKISDANGNVSDILYDALGLPVAMAMKGKENVDGSGNSTEGDTLAGLDLYALENGNNTDVTNQKSFFDDDPEGNAGALLQGATWRCVYDFDSIPAAVGMIARQQHFNNPSPALPEGEGVPLIRISYSDGMGRVMMHKAQAQNPDANSQITTTWIGSGRTIYNNKGNAVMQYEPYFSGTHHCDLAEQAASDGAVSPQLHYDALGRNYRTDLPDGSFTKTEWTPWEQTVWDNNDTVLDSSWYAERTTGTLTSVAEEANAATKAAAHADTPTVMHIDSLARPFYTIQQDSQTTFIKSYVKLDVLGNRIAVVDGNGKVPLGYRYNMLKQPCFQHSIDSGDVFTFTDVAGQPLYNWDADGRAFDIGYDVLRRPLLKKVTHNSVPKTLEVMVYGEDAPVAGPVEALNLRGQLYRHYDGAGIVQTGGYDFKGNPLNVVRTFTQDATIRPDWAVISNVVLENVTHETATLFDALNRPLQVTEPDGSTKVYAYDKGGALFSMGVTGVHNLDTEIINAIYYDAKGQRQKIQYENGTTTLYAYDEKTYRVTNIQTIRAGDGKLLQDLKYWYDPVGNITMQKDGALQSVYYNGTVAEPINNYTYDSLYRLVQAKGREHMGMNRAPTYDDKTRSRFTPMPVSANDTAMMRPYTQSYEYDAVGNMLKMKHTVTGPSGSWTRKYVYSSTNNRLLSCSIGSKNPTGETYSYDNRGNITSGFNHLQSLTFNAENQLESVSLTPTRTAYYQYDGAGQRVRKKIIDTNTNQKSTIKYVGEWEIYRKFVGSSLNTERETLHISDDTGRIALIDTHTVSTTLPDEEQLLRYQYSNHLQSASLELDDEGAVISYEEYYPYGSTSFQSGRSGAEVSLKRYRYTSKERDEESGLYYHGARYYVPWLGRWTSVDPFDSERAALSPYDYCSNNPINRIDEDGMQDHNVHTVTQGETLGAIASVNNTTVNNLMALNPQIEDANKINVGDNINLDGEVLDEVVITEKMVPAGNAMGEILRQLSAFTLPSIPIGGVENILSPASPKMPSKTIGKSKERKSKSSTPNPKIPNIKQSSPTLIMGNATPWMDKAFSQLGVKELTGKDKNNPAIIGYHATTGKFKTDETPWCASFVNWSLTESNIPSLNSARAFDYNNFGYKLDKPAYGAIAVMNYSHVGFVAGENADGRIILLGGNQGDAVNLSPNSQGAVLQYRYPKGYTPNFNLPKYNVKGRSLSRISSR